MDRVPLHSLDTMLSFIYSQYELRWKRHRGLRVAAGIEPLYIHIRYIIIAYIFLIPNIFQNECESKMIFTCDVTVNIQAWSLTS